MSFCVAFCYYFRFKTDLRISLLQISGYKKLYLNVEDLRKIPYDSDNEEHEDQLIEVKIIIKYKSCLFGFSTPKSNSSSELNLLVVFLPVGLLKLFSTCELLSHYTSATLKYNIKAKQTSKLELLLLRLFCVKLDVTPVHKYQNTFVMDH